MNARTDPGLLKADGAPSAPSLFGDDDAPVPGQRKLPDAWVRSLSPIPEPFRAAMIENCWSEHDRVLKKALQTRRPDHLPGNIIERTMAITTAGADISYAAMLPFHLIEASQRDEACAVLRTGAYALSQWIAARHPDACNVMVVGDDIQQDSLNAILDQVLERTVAKKLCAGPGQKMESMLLNYAGARGYTRYCVQGIENDGPASVWGQVPGPKLDRTIEVLFAQTSPARIIALDPVRSPASLQVLEQARKRGIEIEFIETGDLQANKKPAPRVRP